MDVGLEWILEQKRIYGPKRRALAQSFLADAVSHACQYCHDPKAALAYTGNYERALQLSRGLEKWSELCLLVRFLGDFYIDSGRWRPWQDYSETALTNSAADDETLGEIQRCRCRLLFRLGDYDRMQQALDAAEAVTLRGGCLRTAAALLYLRGALARKRHDYDLARRYCRESLDCWRILEDRFETAVALYNLAATEDEDEKGDLGAALHCYEECLSLFRETGHPDRVGRTLIRMARVLQIQGDSRAAATCLADAEGLIDPALQPREWVNLLFMQAQVARALGQVPWAVSLAREAIALARQLRMKTEISGIESFLARLAEAMPKEVAV